jgi:hypothetical protein
MARDLSNLPTSDYVEEASDGWNADPEPRFLGAVIEGLDFRDTINPPVRGGVLNVDDIGKCSRAIGYKLAGVMPSDAIDDAAIYDMAVKKQTADIVRDQITRGLDEVYSNQHVEIVPGLLHGFTDLVAGRRLDDTTVIEVNVESGYGWKGMVGGWQRNEPGRGPKWSDVVRGSVIAQAITASSLVMLYVSDGLISKDQQAKTGVSDFERWGGEWTIGPERFEPMAAAAVERIEKIGALFYDDEVLPRRSFANPDVPNAAEVVDPESGTWEIVSDGQVVATGSWWECGYCRFRTFCATTPSGRLPVSEVDVDL